MFENSILWDTFQKIWRLRKRNIEQLLLCSSSLVNYAVIEREQQCPARYCATTWWKAFFTLEPTSSASSAVGELGRQTSLPDACSQGTWNSPKTPVTTGYQCVQSIWCISIWEMWFPVDKCLKVMDSVRKKKHLS